MSEDHGAMPGPQIGLAAGPHGGPHGGPQQGPRGTVPARPYVGRFAPSPTGPLHAGSLVAALGSWLDARAHGGRWLLRIEDVDGPRCPPGMDELILGQLAACGLQADAAPVWQSRRAALYEAALRRLLATGAAYACGCSRSAIQAALAAQGRPPLPFGELVYPGACRPALAEPLGDATIGAVLAGGSRGAGPRVAGPHDIGPPGGGPRVTDAGAARTGITGPTAPPTNEAEDRVGARLQVHRALRLRLPEGAAALVRWTDRRLGQPVVERLQDVAAEVGDFVLRRADGLFAYQLAVVVDDAGQGVTHVVRGADLADNTPRQILLQRQLGLPDTLAYLHLPLVLAADGHKLSKQNGATPLDLADPQAALGRAAQALGLAPATPGSALGEALSAWVAQWRDVMAIRPAAC